MVTVEISEEGRTVGFADAALEGPFNWQGALDACRLYQEDGKQWRLPTVPEIQALVASGLVDLSGKVLFSRTSNQEDHSLADTVAADGTVGTASKLNGACSAIPLCRVA